MVTNVSSFGRSGVFDWVVQRLSAVVLASYTIYLLFVLLLTPDMDYQQWRALYETFGMRFFSLVTLLALMAHGWIGMWTISTDYLTDRLMGAKATVVRLAFQSGCILLTLLYLVWGVEILWGS